MIGVLVALAFVVVAAAIMLSVPAGFGWAVYKAFPRGALPSKKNAGWLDDVFHNIYVVFAARLVLLAIALVLLFLGLYVATSIAVRMWRREWLRRVGWFEPDIAARVENQVGSFGSATDELLQAVWEQNETLESRLETALQELEQVTAERDRLAAGQGLGSGPG